MIHVRVGELHVVPDPVGTPLDRQLQVDPRLQRGWNGEFPGPSPEQELRVGSRVQQAVRAPRGHLALRGTFHSDALRCTQMHSEALRGTQMHIPHALKMDSDELTTALTCESGKASRRRSSTAIWRSAKRTDAAKTTELPGRP
jgi:hypothetical protein